MRQHLKILAVGLAVSAGAASSALAQDGFVVPDSPYELGLDVGVVYVRLPSVNGFAYSVDHDNYDFIRQYDHSTAIEGFGPSLSAHLGIPDLGGRGWFGDSKLNIDADAFWVLNNLSAGTHLSATCGCDAQFLDLLPVNGGPTFDSLFFDPIANIKSKGTANFEGVDVALTLEHMANADSGLSFLFGPRFAYQSQKYKVTTSSSLEPFQFRTKEDVAAYFIGPEVGVQKVGPLGGGASYHLIARAAALYLDSNLKASQDVVSGSGTVFHLFDQRDSKDTFSGRVELGTGITVPVPNSKMYLSLDGSVIWWSAVPQIVNPRSGKGVNAASKNFPAAHLNTGDMWMAKATVKATIPLD
jgi:hypothetical protein